MNATPSKAQIKAVRKVLYQRDRLDKLNVLAKNISVLMNLNPATELPSNDIRNPAGSGPTWFVPATGAVDPGVQEAANDCDKIAAALMAIRNDVSQVSFPHDDKQHLMASLSAEAENASCLQPNCPDFNPKGANGPCEGVHDYCCPCANVIQGYQPCVYPCDDPDHSCC